MDTHRASVFLKAKFEHTKELYLDPPSMKHRSRIRRQARYDTVDHCR